MPLSGSSLLAPAATGTPASAAPATPNFPCLTNPNPSPTDIGCYSVQQLRNAYDVTPLLNSGTTGKGQTSAGLWSVL